MKPGDMGAALASGQIDAALTWEPTPSILVTKGIVKVIQSFGEVSSDPALLVTTREFAQKDPMSEYPDIIPTCTNSDSSFRGAGFGLRARSSQTAQSDDAGGSHG